MLYTAEDVVPGLGDLVVERAEAVERTVPLPDGEAVAVDALPPRSSAALIVAA